MAGRQLRLAEGLAAPRPALASTRRLTLVTTQRPRRSAFSGVFLIVLGVVFLLGQLGRLDVGDLIRTWWPSFIVLVGLMQLLEGRGTRTGAVTLLVVGGLFQCVQLGYMPWSTVGKLWPVAFIVVGASMILRR